MGKLFTLTASVRAVTQQALDDLITELGKNCLLIYPPTFNPCVNCQSDPIGNKSSNRWMTGGPFPFPDGTICPLCNGEGTRADQTTEVVKMLVAVQPRHFFKQMPAGIQVPSGTIQTKCYLTDAAKVQRAQEMQLQPELDLVARWRYKLDGELSDVSNIVQGRYAIGTWKRIP